MGRKEISNHRFFQGSDRITGDKVIWFSILEGDRKYSLQFSWSNGSSAGKVGIVISNDGKTEIPLEDNQGGFLEKLITTPSGSGILNDYEGVVSRLVGVKFTGVDADFNWSLNFTE